MGRQGGPVLAKASQGRPRRLDSRPWRRQVDGPQSGVALPGCNATPHPAWLRVPQSGTIVCKRMGRTLAIPGTRNPSSLHASATSPESSTTASPPGRSRPCSPHGGNPEPMTNQSAEPQPPKTGARRGSGSPYSREAESI